MKNKEKSKAKLKKTHCKLTNKFGDEYLKYCNSKYCKICEHHI